MMGGRSRIQNTAGENDLNIAYLNQRLVKTKCDSKSHPVILQSFASPEVIRCFEKEFRNVRKSG